MGTSATEADLTLHQALITVLMAHQNEWMSVKDLTAEVSARGLYRMRDGRPPQASQVHARVRNYVDLFEKEGPMVRSRYTVSTTDLPKTGAYNAAQTRFQANDGAEMLVVSRIAYSVIPPGGEDGALYARRMSEERAWRIVAGGGLEAGSVDTALLTTHGWEPVSD